MPPKVATTLVLEHDHLEYLKANAGIFDLPDAGKAFRCAISFVMDSAGAEKVFGVQRGSHERYAGQPHEAAKAKEDFPVELELWQHDWLQAAAANGDFKLADLSKAGRVLMEYCLVELKV